MREAELGWTRKLVDEIRSGTLGDLAAWSAFHRAMDQQSLGHSEAETAPVEEQREQVEEEREG